VVIEATLPGTLNDEYRGHWLHTELAPFQVPNWQNPDTVAHIHSSTYLGGGVHRLVLSDRQALAVWIGDLLLADPNDILVKVNMRPGVFTPGEQTTVLHSNTQLLLAGLWFQNATRMELVGNEDLVVQNCYVETLEWVVKGGGATFKRVYFKNSTPEPIRGCLDVTGAEVVIGPGNTMDGTNVVEPDAGMTSGTLASLWLHDGSHVRVSGGLWLRSHAHIEVDHGTFHRETGGVFVLVQGVRQGGPGYTVPGYVTARRQGADTQSAGAYQSGELAVLGGLSLDNYEYVVAAIGHDISWADDSTVLARSEGSGAWVSADGGASECSYDPGKGTRVRINKDDTVGMYESVVPQLNPGQDVDWARGEDQVLDVSGLAGAVNPLLTFRHPRLGGTHSLWANAPQGGATITVLWPVNVVWPAGVPGAMAVGTHQLYTFRYSPELGKYYGEHALVDVT